MNTNKENTFVVDVKQSETGEYFIQFPQDTMAELGWKEGDTILWNENEDGSYTLSKKMTELVLVECISTFRHRYVVEVPLGRSDWALDTVSFQEAKEFSQKHLGETIVSHRVVSVEEALKLCDEDNSYASTWNDTLKMDTFFTKDEDKQAVAF